MLWLLQEGCTVGRNQEKASQGSTQQTHQLLQKSAVSESSLEHLLVAKEDPIQYDKGIICCVRTHM